MASTGEAWRLGRRPALDGLRGIAILLVVFHHAAVVDFMGGAGVVGVTVFFTLSGYLITSLLVQERERTGRVALGAFYVRRARRLLPALGVFLSAMVALGLAAPRPAAWSVLYVANWVAATGSTGLGGLSHTWSLSVEEQFYLVWPLVFILIARLGRRALLGVSGVGAVVSMPLRLLLWDGGAGEWRVYFGTDTRGDALLIGCLVAVLLAGRSIRPRPAVATLGVIGLVALAAMPTVFGQYVIAPTLAALLTASVIITARAGFLTAPWLRLVGRRSYALYLWHFPMVFLVAPRLAVPPWVGLCVALAASWGLALLSWQFVEQPFLRRVPARRSADVRHREVSLSDR